MKRGFSLVEILVGLAVFGLLSGVIVAVFVLAHRYSGLYSQVSRAQREAVQAMQGIGRELSSARSQSLMTAPAGNACWMLSSALPANVPGVADFDGNGELFWQKWVALWVDGSGDLRLSELTLTGGKKVLSQVDFGLEPTSIAAFSGPTRRLASSIHHFQVVSEGPQQATVELLVETTGLGNPATRYQLRSCYSTQ